MSKSRGWFFKNLWFFLKSAYQFLSNIIMYTTKKSLHFINTLHSAWMNLMSKSCLMGTIRIPLIHKQLCVWWASIQYNSILKDKDNSETVIQLQMESKVLSVLKSTKLLHEHTIYVHACILRASWCKNARYCERNVDVCLVVIGIKDVLKMDPNLHIGCHTI